MMAFSQIVNCNNDLNKYRKIKNNPENFRFKLKVTTLLLPLGTLKI